MAPTTTTPVTTVETAEQAIAGTEQYLTSATLPAGTSLLVSIHHDGESLVEVDGHVWLADDVDFGPVLAWARQRFGAAVRNDNPDADNYRFWVVKPQISRGMTMSADGLTWAHIVYALDWSNLDQEAAGAFRAEHEFAGPVVFVATHSWGDRDWTMAEGRSTANCQFLADPHFNGGWHAFEEGDVVYLFAASATSHSSLTARRQADGTWSLELWAPLDDNSTPYKGCYWDAFHKVALGLESDNTPA